MKPNFPATILFAFMLVASTAPAFAQIYIPLDPFSKFSCVSFPDGKNKTSTIGKNGNKLTSFSGASKSISSDLKTIRDRIRTLNQLKKNQDEIQSKQGLVKKLNTLSRKLLQETRLETPEEIKAALTKMETVLSGQMALRQQELIALQNCKLNKRPLDVNATLKVGVVGNSPPAVVALAVVTSGSVGGDLYCGTVPTDTFGTIGSRKIKDEFEADPCKFSTGVNASCTDLVGQGNLGIVLSKATYLSDPGQAALEGQVASLLAFFPPLIHFVTLPSGVSECP